MQTKQPQIPLRIAKLIIGYLNNLLSDKEHAELDQWVGFSNENTLAFEDLTEDADKNIFDPEEFIDDTTSALELWIVAGLITRYLSNDLSRLQKKALKDWIRESERNDEIFELLTSKANLQKIATWFSLNDYLDKSTN
ncbi:MAG TPA: hypothetical protein VNV85_04950 [Puia sp.]|jgi:hypothetical protein|nr:hypothetical protein [Puia sp.]